MIQKVHNISYLSVNEIELNMLKKDVPREVIALPKNAELISVMIENIGYTGTATLDVRLKHSKALLLNDLELDNVELDKKFTNSLVHIKINSDEMIEVIANESFANGKIRIKALYFLPSTIYNEI